MMLDSNTDLSDGLLRQRRNLLITSLLLIFLQHGGASIETLNVVGTSLKFSNPKAIYEGLWLLFFYFNLRYLQHYFDEGRAKFNGIWDNKFSRNARAQAEAYIRKIVAESGNTKEIKRLSENALVQIRLFNWRVGGGHVTWQEDKYGSIVSSKEDFTISIRLLWKPAIKTCYQTIVLGSSFTDYAIPFLLSAFALGSCSISEWNGSLLKLLLH